MQIQQFTPLPGFRGFLRRIEFALRQRNPALLRDRANSFWKSEIFDLRDETEDISGLAAAEAVEKLLAGVDIERGRFFLVKRAEAGVVLRAGFAQADVAADDFDDVGLLLDGLGEVGHGLISE